MGIFCARTSKVDCWGSHPVTLSFSLRLTCLIRRAATSMLASGPWATYVVKNIFHRHWPKKVANFNFLISKFIWYILMLFPHLSTTAVFFVLSESEIRFSESGIEWMFRSTIPDRRWCAWCLFSCEGPPPIFPQVLIECALYGEHVHLKCVAFAVFARPILHPSIELTSALPCAASPRRWSFILFPSKAFLAQVTNSFIPAPDRV